MIKVAFLSPSLHVGGAERWMLTLAKHFDRRRVQAVGCILTKDFFDQEMLDECRRWMPVLRPREKFQADVVLAWGEPRLAELTEHLQIPVVCVSHSSGEWAGQREVNLLAMLGADYLAAVSEPARGSFPEDVRQHVRIVENGVEVDRGLPRRGRDWQRRAWGVSENQRVALFLGRFAQVKRPWLLIETIKHLPEEWVAGFVGHGPLEAELKARAESEIPGRAFFAPPVAHVGDVLAGADCLVLPSESEASPLVVMEAWHAKLPVVMSMCEWSLEMNRLKFLATEHADDSEAFARAILASETWSHLDWARSCAPTAPAMAARWEDYLSHVLRDWRNNGRRAAKAELRKLPVCAS